MATKTKASSTTVKAASVGSDTDAIKQKFGAQKIPLAGDFAELIDIADVGRKAAGLHPKQDGRQGGGLKLEGAGPWLRVFAPAQVAPQNSTLRPTGALRSPMANVPPWAKAKTSAVAESDEGR